MNKINVFMDSIKLTWTIVFIFIGCLIAFIILFACFFPMFKRASEAKNYKKRYYKKIRKIADIKDYYLINNLTIKNNSQILCTIDHILFGEKYIYVIKDRYYKGALSGVKEDNYWIFFSNEGKRKEITNPIKNNENRCNILSKSTQIDRSFFISIVIINNDCVLKNGNSLNADDSFIVSKSKLEKLIKNIESRDIKKMDQKQLGYAVQDINYLFKESENDSDEK